MNSTPSSFFAKKKVLSRKEKKLFQKFGFLDGPKETCNLAEKSRQVRKRQVFPYQRKNTTFEAADKKPHFGQKKYNNHKPTTDFETRSDQLKIQSCPN